MAIARSRYRPSLSINATASETDREAGAIGQGRVGLQVEQPLFDGFVTRHTVRSAIARVDSKRGTLDTMERDILLSAITAYVDVRRDTDVVDIREANLDFLTQQVRSAPTRYDLGDETNTAIAEAQAREADAMAQLARAQIQAAQLARDGKLNGQTVGLVTTLAVLNAQQDVLAAKLAAIGSERDSILANYTLLAATGHLKTTTLVLPVESYEPSVHYDAVNRQWFGTSVRSAP